jgi:hypothetical protein
MAGRVKGGLTHEDFLIVTGDCQAFLTDTPSGRSRHWVQELGCTVLFIDESTAHPSKMAQLETTSMFGADIGVVGEHLFHLRRGRVYTINCKKWFCFSGGQIVNQSDLTVPTRDDFEKAMDAIRAAYWKVDVVLTHTALGHVVATLPWTGDTHKKDPTTWMLNRFWDLLTFDSWYCARHYSDVEVGKIRFLFNEVVEA